MTRQAARHDAAKQKKMLPIPPKGSRAIASRSGKKSTPCG